MSVYLNNISAAWWGWIAPLSIQVAVLAAFVWVIDLALRKRGWPQVRYALWALVFVRLLLPPSFALPTSVAARLLPPVEIAAPVPTASLAHVADIEVAPLPQYLPPAPATALPDVIPSAAAHTAATAPPVSWETLAFLFWLCGIAAITAYVGIRVFRFSRSVMKSATPLTATLDSALKRAAARLHVRSLPSVVLTDTVRGAAAFGVLRPVLLVPTSVAELSAESAEHIFLHEVAHVKRGDLIVNAAQTVLFIMFWFNPFVWLAARALRRLRELCCDATVAAHLREKTAHYRQTLLSEARRILMLDRKFGLGLLGLFESPASLAARLEHLTHPSWNHRKLRAVVTLLAVVVTFLFVVPMARVTAEPQEPAKTEAVPAAVTIAQDATQVLTGRVLDEDGKPAAGLVVNAYGRQRYGEMTASGKTDATGKFDITAPVFNDRNAYYLLIVKAKDAWAMEPAISENGAAFKEVTLRLSKADAEISGKAIDASGNLLAGVRVSIASLSKSPKDMMNNNWDRDYFEYSTARDAFVAVTDDKGTFKIDTLPKDHVAEVEFSNDTFVKRASFVTGGAPQTVTLVPAGRILARVVSTDPTAKVAGVSLIMNLLDFSRVGGVRFVDTGEDGTAMIDRLEPGKYQVSINRGEEKTLSELGISSVTVESGKIAEATIHVVKGAHITGRIVEKGTGKPFPSGMVDPFFARHTAGGTESMNAGTDEQGYFAALLAPGKYDVSWVRRNRESGESEYGNLQGDVRKVELKPGEDLDIGVMEVPPAAAPPAPESLGSIKGRVKPLEDGIALAGIPVRVAKFEGKRVYRTTKTDTDGTFAETGLDPGRYQVEAFGATDQNVVGVESLSVTVTSGKTSDAEISVVRGSLVTGRVLDKATGEPFTGRGVGISLDMTISETSSLGYMGDSHADGRFSMRLPPGNYEVHPFYKDKHGLTVFVKSLTRNVTLVSGKDVELDDFLVTPVDTEKPEPEVPGGNFRYQ